jgi:hypothetical protein
VHFQTARIVHFGTASDKINAAAISDLIYAYYQWIRVALEARDKRSSIFNYPTKELILVKSKIYQ